MTEQPVDVERACRTCLGLAGPMRPLFEGAAAMVRSLTKLRPAEGDGLPVQICDRCYGIVEQAYAFKIQAEEADARMRDCKKICVKSERCPVDLDIVKTEYNDHSDDSDDDQPLNALRGIGEQNHLRTADCEYPIVPQNKKDRKDLVCKLCNKVFVYFASIKKHLLNHISEEPFATVDSKSREFFLENYATTRVGGSDADDLIIQSMIEDIQAGRFNKYIGESKEDEVLSPKCISNLNSAKNYDETHSIKLSSALKKAKFKIKGGKKIEKLRKTCSHKCSLCFRKFSRTNHLIRHMSAHDYNYPDKCTSCNEVFPNKQFLLRHDTAKCEKTPKPYTCMVCETKFAVEDECKEHTLKRHKNDGISATFVPFEDIVGEKLTQFMVEMKVDNVALNFGNTAKIFSCGKCKQKFIDEISFNDHVIEHHNGENVGLHLVDASVKIEKEENREFDANLGVEDDSQCYDGDYLHENDSFDTDESKDGAIDIKIKREDLKDERKQDHKKNPKLHRCSLCLKLFSRSDHLRRHMKTHNYDYPDKCLVCETVFPNRQMLQKHMLIKCTVGPKEQKCQTCKQIFKNQELFAEHVAKRHPGDSTSEHVSETFYRKKIKPVYCAHCERPFNDKLKLAKHLKYLSCVKKKHVCDICSRRFKESTELISHRSIHQLKKEADSKYHCAICDYSSDKASNMLVHTRRHAGEKPFACKICGSGFARSSDLLSHTRMHTGEKPSLCTICGRGFRRSTQLTRHMRTHTGDRPYKCTYCDQAYTQSQDLALHVRRRHTNDKPYTCDVCGESFFSGTSLNAHRRTRGHNPPEATDEPPPPQDLSRLASLVRESGDSVLSTYLVAHQR